MPTTKLETPPPNAANIVWLPFATDEKGKLIHKKLRGPNPRNREIWDAHRVFERSYRDLAKHYSLSPTRISQIVTQVDKWMAATKGGRSGTGHQRLIVAEAVHEARLDHLFGQALAGWAESGKPSRQMKLVEVTGKPERRETIHKTRDGDRRYLDSGLKIQNSLFAFQNKRDGNAMTLEEKHADAVQVLDEVGVLGEMPRGEKGDAEDAEDTERKAVVIEEAKTDAVAAAPAAEVSAPVCAEVSIVPVVSEPAAVESPEAPQPAVAAPPKKEKKPRPPKVQGQPAPGYYFRPKPANWRDLEKVLLNDKPKDPEPRVQTMMVPIRVNGQEW